MILLVYLTGFTCVNKVRESKRVAGLTLKLNRSELLRLTQAVHTMSRILFTHLKPVEFTRVTYVKFTRQWKSTFREEPHSNSPMVSFELPSQEKKSSLLFCVLNVLL